MVALHDVRDFAVGQNRIHQAGLDLIIKGGDPLESRHSIGLFLDPSSACTVSNELGATSFAPNRRIRTFSTATLATFHDLGLRLFCSYNDTDPVY
jgi:hypothetical protein